MTEDRNFRETFGCGAHTALTTWEMLVDASFLPTNGCLHHLLWALMFMKVYAKEMTMCALAGAIDPGTWRKWTWLFVRAIVSLEPLVVSFSIPYAVTCRIISNLSLILIYRLSGKIDSQVTRAMIAQFLMMEQILGLQNKVVSFTASSLKNQDFDMRFAFASRLGKLFG